MTRKTFCLALACGLFAAAPLAAQDLPELDLRKPLVAERWDEVLEGFQLRVLPESEAPLTSSVPIGEAEWIPPAYDD